MKINRQSLEHIELISSGDTALFEIRLIVAMNDWTDEEFGAGALDWLMNLLSLAASGQDIETGAQEFLKSMMTLNEERVHLCKVETVNLNESEVTK
jgi:predicted RecA/RadA family phage recombinase